MEVARLRSDTPGCGKVVHLNNAGAALVPRPVLRTVTDHLRREAEIGGYEAAEAARTEIGRAYASVARLIGTEPRNVAFTEHATAAFVAALASVPLRRGDGILTTRADYVSNHLQSLSLADRLGVEVMVAPDDPAGGVDLSALEKIIHRRRPRIVAVTHVPTSSGLVQDVAAIGAICHQREVFFLVDACQSVGQMPIDVNAIGCDFLSATARKFLRGPRGVGFLFASDRVLDTDLHPLFPDLRGARWITAELYQPELDARRFETWEFSWALVLGAGRAASYAIDVGMERIRARAWALAECLRDRLSTLNGVELLDHGTRLSAIVSLSVDGWNPAELAGELRSRGINTTGQAREDSLIHYDDCGVDGGLRVSPHYYNTFGELEELVVNLRELVRQ